MKSVRFQTIDTVIGLDWSALSGDVSERRAIKALAEQHKGSKAGVLVKHGGVSLMGLVPAGDKLPKVPSAAAWLALANQAAADKKPAAATSVPTTESATDSNDWIVVEDIGGQFYWFVIIREGVPLPSTDAVVDEETLTAVLLETLESGPYVVYSPSAEVRGWASSAVRVEARGVSDLVAGVKPGKAMPKPLSGVSALVVVCLIFFVLAGAGWWAFSAWQKNQAAKAAEIARLQTASKKAADLEREKSQYVASVKAAVVKALDAGDASIRASLNSPAPAETINAWVELMENVPIDHAGWTLTGFKCMGPTQGKVSCEVALKRSEYGINRLLLEDHPDAVLTGDSATYVVAMDAPESRPTVRSDLEGADAFNLRFVSDLQMLHLTETSYALAPSKEIVQAIKMPAAPTAKFKPGQAAKAGGSAGPIQMGVSTGNVSLKGKALWQLKGMGEFLQGPNLVVKSMSVSVSSSSFQGWSLEGAYYIRSRPEPLLPTITGADGQPIVVELPAAYKASPQELAESRAPALEGSASSEPSPDEALAAPGADGSAQAPAPAPAPDSAQDLLPPTGGN